MWTIYSTSSNVKMVYQKQWIPDPSFLGVGVGVWVCGCVDVCVCVWLGGRRREEGHGS